MMHQGNLRLHALSQQEMRHIVAGGDGGVTVNEIDPPPPSALLTILPTSGQQSLDDD